MWHSKASAPETPAVAAAALQAAGHESSRQRAATAARQALALLLLVAMSLLNRLLKLNNVGWQRSPARDVGGGV